MDLVIATHNHGKLEEFRALLPAGVGLRSAADFGLAEPAETEETFVGNARIKAHHVARATGLPALADDSGLCVAALDGQPGVHTADWAETPQGRDFRLAMERVHQALLAKGAPQPWAAEFRCTLVLARPDGAEAVFEGRMPGQLVWPTRGAEGHGYDPMFQPEGHTQTFAEMPLAQKNAISHRARAVRAFVAECFT